MCLLRASEEVICRGRVAHCAVDLGKVIQTADISHGFFIAALELSNRCGELAFALVDNAEMVMCHHVFRCERDRKLEMLSC